MFRNKQKLWYFYYFLSELGKWDEAREQAIETFKRNKPFMHSTTAGLVERLDLQLTE